MTGITSSSSGVIAKAVYSSRMRRRKRFLIAGIGFLFISNASQTSAQVIPALTSNGDELQVRVHFQSGLNAVAERNLFWNLADTAAPGTGFNSDTSWLEFYVKAGLSFERPLQTGSTVAGKIIGVASYTSGTDAYDFGNTGRTTLEEAFLELRTPISDQLNFDFSLGPRELKLGTGMLVANGGSSGFERGALKFGPRKAWEMAAIATLTSKTMSGRFFYLQPNERPANDGDNKIAGLDFRYDPGKDTYAGVTYLYVLESESSYPRAAPGGIGPPAVTAGARQDLNAINLYAGSKGFEGPFNRVHLTADMAYEWNDRIRLRAWAGRVQAGYAFSDSPRAPTLTYSYQAFSGDDPDTSRLERFDPLHYEGSPSAWATGSKSSMVFINSNVQAHGLALKLTPTEVDSLTLRYAHIRAMELRSPVQFGQATRVDLTGDTANVVSGVTDAHLADDFFIEYSRIINRNTFLTAGLSISVPGKGITRVTGKDTPNWTGGFINVVVNY